MNNNNLNKYSLYDNDNFVGNFTSYEISGMIGCEPHDVYKYMSRDSLYHGRYRFVKSHDDPFYKEWDEARFAILNAEPIIKKVIVKKPFSIWKEKPNKVKIK